MTPNSERELSKCPHLSHMSPEHPAQRPGRGPWGRRLHNLTWGEVSSQPSVVQWEGSVASIDLLSEQLLREVERFGQHLERHAQRLSEHRAWRAPLRCGLQLSESLDQRLSAERA